MADAAKEERLRSIVKRILDRRRRGAGVHVMRDKNVFYVNFGDGYSEEISESAFLRLVLEERGIAWEYE